MNPDQVTLPFSLPAEKEPSEPQPQRPPTIPKPLTAISAEELDRLCSTTNVSTINGLKIVGAASRHPDVADIPLKVCCRCCRWELAKPAERAAYGDLIAQSLTPAGGIEVTWEERVTESCGLVVYLTYLEYVRVVDEKVS